MKNLAVLLNMFVLPGLGTYLIGKKVQASLQLLGMSISFLLMYISEYFVIIGLPIMVGIWVWSIVCVYRELGSVNGNILNFLLELYSPLLIGRIVLFFLPDFWNSLPQFLQWIINIGAVLPLIKPAFMLMGWAAHTTSEVVNTQIYADEYRDLIEKGNATPPGLNVVDKESYIEGRKRGKIPHPDRWL